MDTGEGEGETFKVDAKPNREPVQFYQHRRDMIAFLGLRDDSGSDVVNMLQTLQLTLRKAPEKGVTVVQRRELQ